MNDACCSHLTVEWKTVTNENYTTGWWQCSMCPMKFVPQAPSEGSTVEGFQCAICKEKNPNIVTHVCTPVFEFSHKGGTLKAYEDHIMWEPNEEPKCEHVDYCVKCDLNKLIGIVEERNLRDRDILSSLLDCLSTIMDTVRAPKPFRGTVAENKIEALRKFL